MRIFFIMLLFINFMHPLNIYSDSTPDYNDALSFYNNQEYSKAIPLFKSLLNNPEEKNNQANILFWLSKSCLANNDLNEAEKYFRDFIKQYPDDSKNQEAEYLLGRSVFLLQRYPESLDIFSNFCLKYPDSVLTPQSYFWLGESQFYLGDMANAAESYIKVINDYPESSKTEAARYKLSLIDYIVRENSLLELLNWSHEQYMTIQDDFRKKEKEYQDTITYYQSKISELSERGDEYYNYNELLNIKKQALALKSYYLDELRRIIGE